MADTTSLVALVVSLIALAIASGQLLDAIFGRANGLRQCQASVMGRWADFTRLDWKWSLFGFETSFVTPHIWIRSSVEQTKTTVQEGWDGFGSHYLTKELIILSAIKAQNPSFLGRYTTLADVWLFQHVKVATSLQWLKRRRGVIIVAVVGWPFLILWGIYSHFVSNRALQKGPSTVLEKSQRRDDSADRATKAWIRVGAAVMRRFERPRNSDIIQESADAAYTNRYKFKETRQETGFLGWIDLVRHISEVQDARVAAIETNYDGYIDLLTGDDYVCVELVRRSWELQPLDIKTPLASISLRDLIALCHRLGMKWYGYDPDAGSLRAYGTQKSISGQQIKGLGTIVEFDLGSLKLGGRRTDLIKMATADVIGWQVCASAAADELGMGVLLPNRLLLYGTESYDGFDICGRISDDGKRMDTRPLSTFLEILGLAKPIIDITARFAGNLENRAPSWASLQPRAILLEVLAFSMDIIPMRPTPDAKYIHPLRLSGFGSPLFNIDACRVLLDRLADEMAPLATASDDLAGLHNIATSLAKRIGDSEDGMGSLYNSDTEKNLWSWCERATAYLHWGFHRDDDFELRCAARDIDLANEPDLQASEEEWTAASSRLTETTDPYCALIASHLAMIAHVVGDVTKTETSAREKVAPPNTAVDETATVDFCKMAASYVNNLGMILEDERLRKAVLEIRPERSASDVDRIIREGWLVLMLRGVLWTMSCKIHEDCEDIPIVPAYIARRNKIIWIS